MAAAATADEPALAEMERRLAELEFLVGEHTSAVPIATSARKTDETLNAILQKEAKDLRTLYRERASPRAVPSSTLRSAPAPAPDRRLGTAARPGSD